MAGCSTVQFYSTGFHFVKFLPNGKIILEGYYENRFVADINNFNDEMPAAEYIEAVTDDTVLQLSRTSHIFLQTSGPGMIFFQNLISFAWFKALN